ncbi:hypothetical protein ACQEUU_18685 [Nonomuraea sp. CA-218870]|uniref:hypothetical protein n=1 Tax=Nonomuraea sp. CA-218870 TaxID=3239998 RepID=UPI003D8D5ED7
MGEGAVEAPGDQVPHPQGRPGQGADRDVVAGQQRQGHLFEGRVGMAGVMGVPGTPRSLRGRPPAYRENALTSTITWTIGHDKPGHRHPKK